MNGTSSKIILLLGQTASGKTAFGVRLAAKLSAEILSADSRQIYRGLDLGSGKDIAEYTLADGTRIPYHMIDVADPRTVYTLADYLSDALDAMDAIRARGKRVLVVGGTALYLHSLLCGYRLKGGAPDSEERARLRDLETAQLLAELHGLEPDSRVAREEPENRSRIIRRIEVLRQTAPCATQKERRTDFGAGAEFLVLGTRCDRATVHGRIERRLDARLEQGMLDEARRLHDVDGVSWARMEEFGLEYRMMALHLQGILSFDEMRNTLLCKIRQFAKRQDSWFRKFERDGILIHWMRADELKKAYCLAELFFRGEDLPMPDFKLSETFYGPRQPRV